jgi:hypothetical protein
MEKQEIEKGNKSIAEFMGYTINEDGNFCKDRIPFLRLSDFNYDNNWDCLMPVVEKIAKDYDVRITWMPTALNVTYIDRPDVTEGEITSMGGMTAIENTYIAVLRFIEWYNTKSESRKTNKSK